MKKNIFLLLFLSYFSFLFAQKGIFEMGMYGGKNISCPVNFTENRYHWALKPISSFQLGLSFGYRFNEFYTLRSGVLIEIKGFKDSSYICGNSHCRLGTNIYSTPYLTIPVLNEFHFLNHHLIAQIGFNYSLGYLDFGGNEIGFIGGIGTSINLTQKMKWRLDTKFNRGLKAWRFGGDYFNFDGLITYEISTGLIYAFEKKK
jgi:hypothetical protein